MKNSTVLMSAAGMKRLHSALKSAEATGKLPGLAKRSLSHFLSAQAVVPAALSPAVQTKQIILHIAGDFTTDPATLPDSLLLKDNLQYGSAEFNLLTIQLNKLVKSYQPAQGVSAAETGKCKSVGDCVTLVAGKIKPAAAAGLPAVSPGSSAAGAANASNSSNSSPAPATGNP